MTSFTDGLRQLADFLDAHPTIDAGVQTYNVFVNTKEELADIARLCSWEKVWDETDYFVLRKTFADGLKLDINLQRAKICKRVVVDTIQIPASPARTEEVTKWVCEDVSLLAPTVSR